MIDKKGMRAGIGIIICKHRNQVLLAKRIGKNNAWQFPQGGIQEKETPEQAMWRELHEELGLTPQHCKIVYSPARWFSYYLPKNFRRKQELPLCIGQRQKWFILQLTASEDNICLNKHNKPEFSTWKWTTYWEPIEEVVLFKRKLYKDVLTACAAHLNPMP